MWKELYAEEEDYAVESLIRLTQKKKIRWECEEYNPISLDETIDENNHRVFLASHIFTLRYDTPEYFYELILEENINLVTEKGDLSFSLTGSGQNLFIRPEKVLSYEDRYDSVPAEQQLSAFSNHETWRMADAVIPTIVDSEEVKKAFQWAQLFYTLDFQESRISSPVVKLALKCLQKRSPLDFHRCILDMEYRKRFMEK